MNRSTTCGEPAKSSHLPARKDEPRVLVTMEQVRQRAREDKPKGARSPKSRNASPALGDDLRT